ncbi:MAG: hypothetical protein KAJ46_00780 [Sedimentisphaerales bacterium]|nr:hypothetical protein [Sedimentisphaerales bacterium]
MAKMFYTFEEVREKLGVTEDQLKQLVQGGKLREFRDGAKVMFKVDEVDDFSPLDIELEVPTEGTDGTDGTGEAPVLDDSSDLLGMSDTAGSSIGLIPMETGSQIGLMPSDTADQIGLDDTTGGAEKDDTVLTASGVDESQDESGSGIGIMDEAPLTSDLDDRVPLDASGSGSGLLDLSREADDTSLGAELLEEIYPSADEGAVETQLPTQMDITPEPEPETVEMEAQLSVVEQAKAVRAYDHTSGVFGAMLIVPFLVLIYMCCAATAALADVQPAILTKLSGMTIWYVLGGAAGVSLLILLIGSFVVSQAGQPRAPKVKKPKKPKQARPKKVKKKK